MKVSRRQPVVAGCDFIKCVVVIICLLLLSCSEEGNRVEEPPSAFNEEDIQHGENLNFYLYNDYACSIQSVSITESSVRISGEYVGEGNFLLGEKTP